MAAPHPSPSKAVRLGSPNRWKVHIDFTPGCTDFLRFKQLSANCRVRHLLHAKKRHRYRDGLFCVIRSLTNPPFMLQIAAVAWDNVPGKAMKSADSPRVPAQDISMGQHLGLFAYGIA